MWIDELGGAAGKGKGKGSSPVQQASRWSKIAKEQKKIEKKSKIQDGRGVKKNEICKVRTYD